MICRFLIMFQHTAARRRLGNLVGKHVHIDRFNTQPPEGGWVFCFFSQAWAMVSTHSRPKAAGTQANGLFAELFVVSTHSRPKAAGGQRREKDKQTMGFNTQPPEGGWRSSYHSNTKGRRFQHTAARRRLAAWKKVSGQFAWFQHTAARRRLVCTRLFN